MIFICFLAATSAVSFVSFRYPLKYIDIIEENTQLYEIDPSWVCAIIHAESKFAVKALSHKGASGLMQVTEATAEWIAERMRLPEYNYESIFDPDINIKIGCNYLAWLLNHYRDNMNLALAAYNAGSGNVDKWLKNPEYSKDGASLDYIPFAETRDYVKRVNANRKIYLLLLKNRQA
jgi:soluble lytic murein transglycosylase